MAWVEKSSRTAWRVRYWKDDGTLGSVSGFSTKTAADQHAADMESDQRAGTFIDPAAGKTTVADWVRDWLPAIDVSIRTEEGYRGMLRNHILLRWGSTALSAVSGIQVAAWTKELRRRPLAPATVSSILKLFTMIMADAVAERLIAYNPVQPRRRGRAHTTRPSEQIWASPDEVLAIADQAAACYDPYGAMLIVTAAWTGARWGELAGLHRDNLHLGDGCVVIDPDVGSLHEGAHGQLWLGPPKNAGSARTISLPEFLIPLLNWHLHDVDSDFVFVTPDGHWHRRSNFARRCMRPAADGNTGDLERRAKFTPPRQRLTVLTDPVKPGLTFHGLRHSHKTWMIADLVPEIAQSRRLGHILHDKIQQTYSHVALEVEQRLLEGLQDRWAKAVVNAALDVDNPKVRYRRLP
ncbi:tyrosine-type recombinase/integrase [Jatrophihabitans lederbergiae]|uniref:Tyrosine-type recombinase/integrase n=1 Tax=Jatrophihabitans lederbergiae TaxID=3075547 RepID=A0ABU2JEH6_9ACTN|nr:tyrosine-type recombinase/integrase [Jatrophihabitans sp. DSM 44399]MDT0263402.1 tyrosine-type recombinase/integrase [Jatrophihabitans sp. DSM 44399]